VFIAGVVDSGDKLFTGVNDTCDILSPVTLLRAIKIVTSSYDFLQNFIDFMNLAINLSPVTTTPEMKLLHQISLPSPQSKH
jgi:hypothetical protein